MSDRNSVSSNEHSGHRSRMKRRFLLHGLSVFDDHNVLELLLFYALPRKDTNALAHQLLDTFGNLSAVFEASPEALMRVEGLGENAVSLIRLFPEVERRCRLEKEKPEICITSPDQLGRYVAALFLNISNETVFMLCLDARFRLIDCRQLGHGSTTAVAFNLMELALVQKASSVVLAHNHPNGFAIPSAEDRRSTESICQALSHIGVNLLDHIIVADDDYVSMRESGMLP